MWVHIPKPMINHASELLQAKWIKGQARNMGLCPSICMTVSTLSCLLLALRQCDKPRAGNIKQAAMSEKLN